MIHQPIGILRAPADVGSIEMWTYGLARRLAHLARSRSTPLRPGTVSDFEVAEGVCYPSVTTEIYERMILNCRGFANVRNVTTTSGTSRSRLTVERHDV